MSRRRSEHGIGNDGRCRKLEALRGRRGNQWLSGRGRAKTKPGASGLPTERAADQRLTWASPPPGPSVVLAGRGATATYAGAPSRPRVGGYKRAQERAPGEPRSAVHWTTPHHHSGIKQRLTGLYQATHSPSISTARDNDSQGQIPRRRLVGNRSCNFGLEASSRADLFSAEAGTERSSQTGRAGF